MSGDLSPGQVINLATITTVRQNEHRNPNDTLGASTLLSLSLTAAESFDTLVTLDQTAQEELVR